MPIVNLTPHGVSLYHAPHLENRTLTFERSSGGFLLVGYLDEQGVGRTLGFTRWNKSDAPARAAEVRSLPYELLVPDLDYYQGPGAVPGNVIEVTRRLPCVDVRHGDVSGLPDFVDGTFYIVSLPTVEAVRQSSRTTRDLLTPGNLIRDPSGEIAGCTSFYRWGGK